MYKKINTNHATSNQKLPSVDNLNFSQKVLKEYSKNNAITTWKKKKKDLLIRNSSLSIEPSNAKNNSFSSLLKVRDTPNHDKDSGISLTCNKKVQKFKSFCFELPKIKSENFLINTYSIPNGLVRVKSELGENKKKKLDINANNPFCRYERKGLIGGKLVRVNKRSKKLMIFKCKNN